MKTRTTLSKKISPYWLKKFCLTFLIGIANFLSFAQPGTPSFYDGVPTTSTNAFPFAGASNKVVWVHPPGSFTTNGTIGGVAVGGGNNITKIYIRMVGANPTFVYTGFEISMKQTGATTNTFTAGAGQPFLTGMTQVYYNNAFQFTGITANSWYGITLQTPFTYDPSQSLYVECKSSNNGTTNTVNSLTVTGVNSRIFAAYAATTGTGGTGLTPLGIDVIPNSPCVSPPTPGTATTSSASVCTGGTALLGLTGQSNGSGQTYQWESSATSGGTFTPIGASSASSGLLINPTAPLYYRCQVTCGASTLPSTEVFVNVPPLFPGGFYTIDKTLSTGSGNYASFAEAVSAVSCGIAGPVIFEVASGTGPYTEQVTIPQIGGVSATNTITFIGNNETLTYNATVIPYHTLGLNGADYIRVNELNIVGTNATNALVGHLWNNADNNIFTACTFSAPTNGTSTLQVPFSCSGSETSATAAGLSGSNNELISCTMNSGYYNTCFVGNSAVGLANTGNKVINCNLRDYYFYGSYNLYQNGLIVSGNTIERPTRTNLSTFYGVYLSTGCINVLVEKNKIRNAWAAVPTSTGTTYGIYQVSAATLGNEVRIENNLISDINFNGTIYGIQLTGHAKCYHNTISLNQTGATGTTTTYGIYVSTTTAAGLNIQNNNVSITRGGTGAKYALFYASAAGIISNYNNLHVNAAAGNNCTGFYVTGFGALGAWQGANAGIWDQQSISVVPNFVAPSLYNYKPTNSLMDNLGNTTLGITSDILGVTRSATPDMGCYEFAPPVLDAAISWVAPVGPFVPGLQTVTVNISNNAVNTITDLTLSYTDGVTPVTETFTGLSIPSGTNQNFSFTTQYNITANGTLQASIVDVNNVLDDNLLNDNTLVQTICLAFSGGTYTIDKNFPTGGGNYTSFADAVAALNCGIAGPVVFNVVAGSGPYNEQVSIGTVVGTSAVNTLTFNGNGNTLSFNATLLAAPHTFVLNGTDFVRVNNMIMEGTGPTYALVCHLWSDADNNQFTNCTFNAPANGTSTTQVPFSVSGSPTSATTSGPSGNNNIVDGCTMFSGYYNTCFVGNSGLANTGNQLINSNIRDQYFYGSYNLYQNGMIIRGNSLTRPTRTTLSTYYGIYVVTGCTNTLVEKNKISNAWATTPASTGTTYGIYCSIDASLGNENKFYNNVVSDINFNGTIYGMYMLGADYFQAYHNTVSLDQTSATGTTTTYGIYCTGTVAYDVRNNNVTISRGGTGVKYAMTCSTPAVAICNNNNLYVSSTTGTNCVGFTTVGYLTLSAWQGTGLDLNSTSFNPFYLSNALTLGYYPTNTLLDNTGINLSVATDITGAMRSITGTDVGCYEFSTAPTNTVYLKFFIQGYYISSGMMISARMNQGCPSPNTNTVAAEVTVELYQAMPPYSFVDATTAVLMTNGLCNATFQNSYFGFYYIVVKSCNSLETASAQPVNISQLSSVQPYDFSNSLLKAYDDNPSDPKVCMANIEPNVYAFLSGDISGDGNIGLSDWVEIKNDIINFQNGCVCSDLDGNSNVDLSDEAIFLTNLFQWAKTPY